VTLIKGIKGDHCLLKASAVKRAGRKSNLVNDKERGKRERGSKRNYTKKAMESVEIESKNLT
jgi:hypothetical protein